jgi:hypothetical protein
MNSPSLRNRWPWKDQSGGERNPERQIARDAGTRARWRSMGQRLALVTAMALGAWLIWAPPSDASRWKYKAVQIVQAEQLEGLPDWLYGFQKRVMGASWTFYADGQFVYADPDRTLHGRYQGTYPFLSFHAEARSETSTSRLHSTTTHKVEGTLDFRNARPLLSMEDVSEGGSMTMTGGQILGERRRGRFRAQVTVVQASQ